MVAVAYLSLSGKGRGGRLLTFSASRMGAYSRWVLIRGWALIRINTVCVRQRMSQLDVTRIVGIRIEAEVIK